MKVQLDLTKTYAIALEGGGAKGGYEIGVWKALEEMGVKYNAVAGTSVGALNGAMMAMRDLPRAISAWKDISLEKVIDFEKSEEENLKKIVSGDIERRCAPGSARSWTAKRSRNPTCAFSSRPSRLPSARVSISA